MSKVTTILFVIALISLVEGKGIFNKIKDTVGKIHDKVKDTVEKVHDKIHEKHEEHHHKHHDKHHDKHHNHVGENELEYQPNFSFPSQPENWEGPKLKMKPAVLYFNIDDSITHFYVNQNEITFQFSETIANTWNKTKKMQMYLYPGDIIKVIGQNYGHVSGFVGSILLYDKKGRKHTYTTNDHWYCNGKKAIELATNDGHNKDWGYFPLIDKSAKWIWDSRSIEINKPVTCVFKVPCK